MKRINVKVDCNIKNKKNVVGDEFKPQKKDMILLNRLNEKGFIEPLTKKELLEIFDSFNLKKEKKKEEL